jgi:2-oxoacid:acceptor oxidoreductase gamma subunit (pyruvate/2-ketoisovalerate family)
MSVIDPQEVMSNAALEIRGDGKAGGGLILAFQSLAALLQKDPQINVQEWPFFSSARRGANIRSFMRASRKPITAVCEVSRPKMTVLMNEGAARTVDFAQGVPPGGTFVINTRRTPEECAHHFKLSGRVFTVPGDEIGKKTMKAPMGNVSTYVTMAHAIGGVSDELINETFLAALKKRNVPDAIIESNRKALVATPTEIKSGDFEQSVDGKHEVADFEGYGELPVGAQTALRLSQTNRTADYAPSGLRLRFEDPSKACTGCAHCITNCPEGIILFERDSEKGVQVTGVDVTSFCKLCRECIAVCPEHLFRDVPFEEKWEEVPVS